MATQVAQMAAEKLLLSKTNVTARNKKEGEKVFTVQVDWFDGSPPSMTNAELEAMFYNEVLPLVNKKRKLKLDASRLENFTAKISRRHPRYSYNNHRWISYTFLVKLNSKEKAKEQEAAKRKVQAKIRAEELRKQQQVWYTLGDLENDTMEILNTMKRLPVTIVVSGEGHRITGRRILNKVTSLREHLVVLERCLTMALEKDSK